MRTLLSVFLAFTAALLRGQAFTDPQTFFANHPGQVFHQGESQEFRRGFREDAKERSVLTWDGHVNGDSLYLEIERDRLKVITSRGVKTLHLRRAKRRYPEPWLALDHNNVELYVSDGGKKRPAVLCIESFAEGVHRSTPDKEVYVVVDPLHRARVYRMPRRHASALSLVRMGDDSYGLPTFMRQEETSDQLVIQYFRLTRRGWQAAGSPIRAQYAPGDVFRFKLLSDLPHEPNDGN